MARRRPHGFGDDQPDLFASSPDPQVRFALAGAPWPAAGDFPVNHARAKVSNSVWGDLVDSADPVVVAGFTSIGKIIELISALSGKEGAERVRVVLGTEPFASDRLSFGTASIAFTARFAGAGARSAGLRFC